MLLFTYKIYCCKIDCTFAVRRPLQHCRIAVADADSAAASLRNARHFHADAATASTIAAVGTSRLVAALAEAARHRARRAHHFAQLKRLAEAAGRCARARAIDAFAVARFAAVNFVAAVAAAVVAARPIVASDIDIVEARSVVVVFVGADIRWLGIGDATVAFAGANARYAAAGADAALLLGRHFDAAAVAAAVRNDDDFCIAARRLCAFGRCVRIGESSR